MPRHALASDELDQRKAILLSQAVNIATLIVAGLGVWVFTFFFPTFFNYPYLTWGGWESVGRFWPMFAWVGVIAAITTLPSSPIHASEKRLIFGYSIVISVLAGIWEELGYRWIFICYAMMSVIVANWVFGAGLGWLLAAVLTVVAIALVSQKKIIFAVPAAIGAVLAAWFVQNANIVYWFYENVLVVIIHFTTFYQMDSMLYSENDKIFLFGAILANTWFRDGHKYQGLPGTINAWYCGMVFLYATVTYGLLTAIVVHALYDIIHGSMRFVFRRSA